jgi:N-acetylglucosaminyldiphosphoundecaprenol N-acetyl-beta-D-mannosaminyltransferase
MKPSPFSAPNKQRLFGIEIDAVRMAEAVRQLRQWIFDSPPMQPCRYIVTPNVDHTVLLTENPRLRAAYQSANLVLADGHPIVWASRLLRRPLPERVPGSELVPKLFDSIRSGERLRVFLLGAAEGVAVRAAVQIKARWQYVETVGTYSPPLGFEKCPSETNFILGRIQIARPDVVVVGLGAPKQEIWVHQNLPEIHAKVALCAGATIDFLAGEKKRAPVWMQNSGIEWLHRMCSEPRRLGARYAKDAWIFPQIVFRQWRSQLG